MAKLLLATIILVGTFLRLYRITESPPGLYVDEADVGFQAYSLIKTGKDYFGNALPIHLQSFADFRAPFYIWSTTPFVLIFGLTPFAVRLPAALFGILSIPAIYVLANKYFPDQKFKLGRFELKTGLLAAFILAVTPWHIHYSRMAFEVTALLLFLILGLYFYHKKRFFTSIFFFLLTPYTYSTAKLFTPLLLIFLFYRKELRSHLPKILFVATLLSLPFLVDTANGKSGARFSILSIFSDQDINFDHQKWLSSYSNQILPFAFVHPATQSGILLSKPVAVFARFSQNYLSAFSPEFLVNSGDPNIRHSVPGFGVLGLSLFLLFIAGFIKLIEAKSLHKNLIIFLLLTSPISAALTRDGENHATRLFIFILPVVLVSALGLGRLKNKFLLAVLLMLVTFGVARDYLVRQTIYPKQSFASWNWGWDEVADKVTVLAPDYKYVIIDQKDNEPLQILYSFYSSTDPKAFRQKDVYLEDLGLNAKQFFSGNIYFASTEPAILSQPLNARYLFVLKANRFEKPINHISVVDSILDPLSQPSHYFLTNQLVTTPVPKILINSGREM